MGEIVGETEMSFDKEFPSLVKAVDKMHNCVSFDEAFDGVWNGEEYVTLMENHCLDKAKVKEAIIMAKAKSKPDRNGEFLSTEMVFKLLETLLGLDK